MILIYINPIRVMGLVCLMGLIDPLGLVGPMGLVGQDIKYEKS